jgi:hypothetical protein
MYLMKLETADQRIIIGSAWVIREIEAGISGHC